MDDHLYTDVEQESRKAAELNAKYEKALAEEHKGDDLTIQTNTVLRNSAPMVAAEMVYLALHSPKDNVRLNAGKYVIDRVLGPTNGAAPIGDPFAELLLKVSKERSQT